MNRSKLTVPQIGDSRAREAQTAFRAAESEKKTKLLDFPFFGGMFSQTRFLFFLLLLNGAAWSGMAAENVPLNKTISGASEMKSKQETTQFAWENVRNGVLCLTFDDARYQEWLACQELFQRYGARATFFYHGELTEAALDSMRKLLENGHSVGLHTLSHRNSDLDEPEQYDREQIQPQLRITRAAGIPIRYFAYPNNIYSAASDELCRNYFRHCRAGLKPEPTPAKGYRIADQPQAFLPLNQVASTYTLGGAGIGTYYETTLPNLDEALEKAARENKMLLFYSHGISDTPRPIDMSIETLEHLLRKASELGLAIVGMDQLP